MCLKSVLKLYDFCTNLRAGADCVHNRVGDLLRAVKHYYDFCISSRETQVEQTLLPASLVRPAITP